MQSQAMTDTEYHAAADRLLAAVERQADEWLQEGVIDIDASRAGGMVELAFPNGTRAVINKQPPLHEIWLAARGGGFHFRLSEGAWHDSKDGREFFERLSDESSAQAGQRLDWAALRS
jgi:CyaY protein